MTLKVINNQHGRLS